MFTDIWSYSFFYEITETTDIHKIYIILYLEFLEEGVEMKKG